MLVDSHCHLNCIELNEFDNNLENVLKKAEQAGIKHFLSVCVTLDDFPRLQEIAEKFPQVSISVGVHPNEETSISKETLCELAKDPACIAIGETGLDYYRTEPGIAQDLQRDNFRAHIQAALQTRKPLIIHTRQAAEDTLQIMQEENASDIGGVMHCFSEDLNIAQRSIDLNFYISFSGILTFKNATTLHQVAQAIPLDRILIETDSPWLAPVPFRGKQNHPELVKYVAQALADLRGENLETIAKATTENFYRCFRVKEECT